MHSRGKIHVYQRFRRVRWLRAVGWWDTGAGHVGKCGVQLQAKALLLNNHSQDIPCSLDQSATYVHCAEDSVVSTSQCSRHGHCSLRYGFARGSKSLKFVRPTTSLVLISSAWDSCTFAFVDLLCSSYTPPRHGGTCPRTWLAGLGQAAAAVAPAPARAAVDEAVLDQGMQLRISVL
mgnify:FL=1